MFGNIIPMLTQIIPSIGIKTVRHFNTTYTAFKGVRQVPWKVDHTKWPMMPINKMVRNRWPYPNEVKRVRTHGYQTRMSTLHGRKILMRRILAGRFVLSH